MGKYRLGAATLAALLLMAAGAAADVWSGQTQATDTEDVLASADGRLEQWNLRVGQRVTAETLAGVTAETYVFAPISGRVSAIRTRAGEAVNDGVLMVLEPLSPYEVRCSVGKGYHTVDNSTVRIGQSVWVRCSVDGSHRAVGRVTALSGEEFTLEIVGGELFIGEAVFIYKEGSFQDTDLIGTGTVIESDTMTITGGGYVLRMRVGEGEEVERGQLLCTTASALQREIYCESDGIVTEVRAGEGAAVEEFDVVARIATDIGLVIATGAENREKLRTGTRLHYWRADDPHTLRTCTVTRLLLSGDGTLTAELAPEEGDTLPIGLGIFVTDEGD